MPKRISWFGVLLGLGLAALAGCGDDTNRTDLAVTMPDLSAAVDMTPPRDLVPGEGGTGDGGPGDGGATDGASDGGASDM